MDQCSRWLALAVSRYSKHVDLATDLVLFLTSIPEQKRRALEASFNPSRPDLYRVAEVLEAKPFTGFLGLYARDCISAFRRPVRALGGVAASPYG